MLLNHALFCYPHPGASGLETVTVPETIRFSMSEAPSELMQSRRADERVGYFTTVFQDLGDHRATDSKTRSSDLLDTEVGSLGDRYEIASIRFIIYTRARWSHDGAARTASGSPLKTCSPATWERFKYYPVQLLVAQVSREGGLPNLRISEYPSFVPKQHVKHNLVLGAQHPHSQIWTSSLTCWCCTSPNAGSVSDDKESSLKTVIEHKGDEGKPRRMIEM